MTDRRAMVAGPGEFMNGLVKERVHSTAFRLQPIKDSTLESTEEVFSRQLLVPA
jgi:hypothetical protein